MLSILFSLNGTISDKKPFCTQTLPNRDSKNCATVILLGIACGLTIISGFIPFFETGISLSGNNIPIVPF